MSASPPPHYALRAESEGDLPFLEHLYAATRADELALTDWDDRAKARFCAQQFAAQRAWYLESYPDAERAIVESGGAPVGRLYVEERSDEIRLIDVSLVPEARGRGIGTKILESQLARGRDSRKAVTIHVERFNRALSLYARLGFGVREDRGVYLFLEWRAGTETAAAEEASCSRS